MQLGCGGRSGQPHGGLLVLDDVLSAVDLPVAQAMFDGLQTRERDTVLMVLSSPLPLLHRMDVVVVCEAGEVVDVGPPAEVLAIPATHHERAGWKAGGNLCRKTLLPRCPSARAAQRERRK